MFTRKSSALWEGSIQDGKGTMAIGTGHVKMDYSFVSRFGDGKGTNPEELIAAAHAGCFSMALSMILGNAGFKPVKIHTTAAVSIDREGGGFIIRSIKLSTEGIVPSISAEDFQKYALEAKDNCPVSVALKNVKSMELEAKLV